MQERYEADFRFSLARLREYAEQVALLRGERAERQILGNRFAQIDRQLLRDRRAQQEADGVHRRAIGQAAW